MGLRGAQSLDVAVRIKRRVEVTPAGCWVWQGTVSNVGYGMMRMRAEGRNRSVHRVSYERFVGPIPVGLQLDHLCRVRACCNPEHLEPVTASTNARRGASPAAMNAAKTHCVNGHEFTPENTRIRRDTNTRQCKPCEKDRYLARKALL